MEPGPIDFLNDSGEMAAAIRRHDWASSPLGPVALWPDVLKVTVASMLASRFPQALVWGPELITIHNDAFVPILGDKPPGLGRSFSDVWSEAWDDIRPIAEAAFAGEATYIQDFPLVVERGNGPEQAFFTFCYSPVRDQRGRVVGFFDTVMESTDTVVANRSLKFLDGLGRALANATDPDLILATTTRMVGEHLALSNCAYADMDPDQDGFTIRGDWAAAGCRSIVGHYSLADFGARAVRDLGAGEPLIMNDNRAELPPHEAATFQAIGIAATICLPLVKHGRLTALMAIHDRVPRVWSSYDLALIREATERSWAHIERVRADAELRASVAALARLNETLEERVEERTARLVEAEAALRQSQKMEAIGQLTGGVAHDFNNLLTVIRSSVDLLARPNLSEERRSRYIAAISDTVRRAAKLTGQLLAFARRQALSPEVFDAGQDVAALIDMVRVLTGTWVEIVTDLPTEPCFVHADPTQFDTALVNMAVNARDAMNGDGRLTLSVRAVTEIPAIRAQPAVPGDFVAIRIEDTGIGIPPERIEQIFEPFYTTKPVGHGTGLGLSQVIGFAKQSGGEVRVDSEPGRGTTFVLYLPRTEANAAAACPEPEPLVDGHGTCVLVVEDNADVGTFATQTLAELGYATIWVTSAEDALKTLRDSHAQFDVVFSDVVMPGMNGIELGQEIRRLYSDLPVVLTSGYSHVLARNGNSGFEVLLKPYSIEDLSRMLRKVATWRRRKRIVSSGRAG